MKYKNPKYKKSRNAFPLEVSCGHCKTPMVIYENITYWIVRGKVNTKRLDNYVL